jgi:hypothetical protein
MLLPHSTPRHTVTLVADVSRQGHVSQHPARQWHFGDSGSLVLIAPSRVVTSLQGQGIIIASTNREPSPVTQTVSPETGKRPELVSRIGARVPRNSMSLRAAQPLGTVIGTGIATISGMATVAVS